MDADVTDGRGSDLCLSARSVKIRGLFLLLLGLVPRRAPCCRVTRESHFWRHDSYSLRGRRLVVVLDAPGLSRRDISLRKLERTVSPFAFECTTTTRRARRTEEARLRASGSGLQPPVSSPWPFRFCNCVHYPCITEGAALFTDESWRILGRIFCRESGESARIVY
jgi:hypothetical protein